MLFAFLSPRLFFFLGAALLVASAAACALATINLPVIGIGVALALAALHAVAAQQAVIARLTHGDRNGLAAVSAALVCVIATAVALAASQAASALGLPADLAGALVAATFLAGAASIAQGAKKIADAEARGRMRARASAMWMLHPRRMRSAARTRTPLHRLAQGGVARRGAPMPSTRWRSSSSPPAAAAIAPPPRPRASTRLQLTGPRAVAWRRRMPGN